MNHIAFRTLLDKAFAQTLTDKERQELVEQLADVKNEDVVDVLLGEKWDAFENEREVISQESGEAMLRKILAGANDAKLAGKEKRHGFYRRANLMVACTLLTVLSAMAYFFLDYQHVEELTLSEAVERNGIHPGKERATVLLSDGRHVILEDSEERLLADEHGTRIINKGNGLISYEISEENRDNTVYNTIQIPKGGEYNVWLEDGTKIHLNSESVLRFPIQFPKHERVVELVGEGYFDVAEEESRRFLVKTPGQNVEVLGTTFNVSAYPNLKEVKTTLVDGSVRVFNQGSTIRLKPGEVAICDDFGGNILVETCDLDRELAWHHGYFVFRDEHIVDIMTRIARWYDVEVVYKGEMEGVKLGGIFQRSKNIVQLLESFKATGLVDFSIEERRVIVMRE